MNPLKQLGIDLILFDLDDTLLDTNQVFKLVIGFLQQKLSEFLRMELSEFKNVFDRCLLSSREVNYVDPIPLWETTLDLLIQEYPQLKEHKDASLDVLMGIYNIEITLKNGVLEMLRYLKDMGVKIGIVTNANEDWTMLKLRNSGLDKIFPLESVYIVNGKYRKTKEHWMEAIKLNGSTPQHTIIAGDNIKADIEAGLELGATVIFLHDPKNNWGVHSEGLEKHKGKFINISDFTFFVQALEKLASLREFEFVLK